MAVTYADLVAFGFAYVEDNVSANAKNQRLSVKRSPVPLLSSEDTCLCKEEDFIVFAEFSEVKGPVALFTVPSYVQHNDKIDVNSFIMRIMSVDYQANLGGRFSIAQDTQTLQTYVSHGRHAYVHYFTLNDLHARGFVRPLCVAYVSSNQNKLHRIFPELRERFLKVTEFIKVNNRQHFKNEISSVLLSMKCALSSSQFLCEEPLYQKDHSTQQYEDFSYMHNIVEESLIGMEYTLAALDHWHSTLTFRDESPIPKEIQDYVSLVSSPSYRKPMNFNDGFCMLEKQLRPIPVLCPWGAACALSQLIIMLQHFGSCELSASVGSFPSISSVKCKVFPSKIEEESLTAWEVIGKVEFLQLLQAIASGALDASTPSLEEKEFLQVEGSNFKEETSGNEGSSSYHSLSDSSSEPVSKLQDINQPPSRQFLSGSNGSSFESWAPENQDVVLFHNSFHTVNDSSVSPSSRESQEDFKSVIESCSPPQTSLMNHLNEKNVQCSDVPESDTSSSDSESFHDILEALHSDDNWSVGSADDALPLGVSWSHCLWSQYKPINKSGHRLLKFFWTYRAAAQHVLYSLLTGRTLVLTGDASSEQRVLRVINALSPLVPPLDDKGLRVLRWHQGILVSAHIASFQLIGMCIPERLSIHDMISPRDKNCVTILDVNSEQLLGPAYHGNLLAAVGNNVRDFPGDHCLLLYLECVLSGIGRKLQAYKALVSACNQELPSHACRQLDLHGCDADIIRYLSKLTI